MIAPYKRSGARLAFKDSQSIEVLANFMAPVRMPWMIEVPMSRMERFRSYLPWSWNRNHRTKLIRDPNAPKFFRCRREITP